MAQKLTAADRCRVIRDTLRAAEKTAEKQVASVLPPGTLVDVAFCKSVCRIRVEGVRFGNPLEVFGTNVVTGKSRTFNVGYTDFVVVGSSEPKKGAR